MPAPEYREGRDRVNNSRETRQSADNDSTRAHAERQASDQSKDDSKYSSDKSDSSGDKSSDQKKQE
jgi:hypothetical protein